MLQSHIPTNNALSVRNPLQGQDATQDTVLLQDGSTDVGGNAHQNADTVDKTDECYASRTIEK